MINRLEKYFEPVLIVALVSSMTLLIAVQIVLRAIDVSFPEAEEIARLLFIWAVYLSISYAIRDDRHIRILVFVEHLPEFLRNLALNISDLLFMTYSLLIVVFGIRIVSRSLELGQIVPATELPVAVVYASIVVSSALCILRLGRRIYVRTRDLDLEDSA